eukprot:jgi/Mesen1/9246/ME000006S09248
MSSPQGLHAAKPKSSISSLQEDDYKACYDIVRERLSHVLSGLQSSDTWAGLSAHSVKFKVCTGQSLNQRVQQLPLEDVLFLHNLYHHVEDFLETTGSTQAWDTARSSFLNEVEKVEQAVKGSPEDLAKAISELRSHLLERVDSANAVAESRGGETTSRSSVSSRQDVNDQLLLDGSRGSLSLSEIEEAGLASDRQRSSVAEAASTSGRGNYDVYHGSRSESRSFHGKDSEPGKVFLDQGTSQCLDSGRSRGGVTLQAHASAGAYLDRERYVEAVGQVCELLRSILRPADERDLVGFGLEEILGIRLRKAPECDAALCEQQPIFYVTNRVAEESELGMGVFYGSRLDSGLNYGLTKVNCPRGKPQVKRDEQQVRPVAEEAFKEQLRQAIAQDEKKSRGLGFEGPAVVFSWPTGGRPPLSVGLGVIDMYRKDEATSMLSAPDLQDVVKMVSTELGAKAVHIVAYSMGSRPLLQALRTLEPRHLAPDTTVTSHIYFMAPDVAAQEFSQAAREFKFPALASAAAAGKVEVGEGDKEAAAEGEVAAAAAASASASRHVHTRSRESVSVSVEQLEKEQLETGKLSAETARRAGKHLVVPHHSTAAGEAGEVGGWEPALGVAGRSTWMGTCGDAGGRSSGGGEGSSSSSEGRGSSNGNDDGSSSVKGDGKNGGRGGSGGDKERERERERECGESVLEQLADVSASIMGDTVSAIRLARRVWQEGRTRGWKEVLSEVFGPDDEDDELTAGAAGGGPGGGGGGSRSNAHLHLYAAQNDIALLLSELMDAGVPQVRAGRRTRDFLLCNRRAFATIDASALKSGLLTTGHFYLFHDIVRADMRYMVDGHTELPWWRQLRRWNKYDYFKLRQVAPPPHQRPGSILGGREGARAPGAAAAGLPRVDFQGPLSVSSSPLLWASP